MSGQRFKKPRAPRFKTTWTRNNRLWGRECEATSVRSSVGFKISAWVRKSSVTSNTLWASVNFFGQITIQRYLFCVHSGDPDLTCPGTSLYERILWMHLEKIEPTQEHFKYTARKLMLLKSVLLMTYSSRKLSNKKVITKACNVWRQIACSFQVYGRTTHHNFCAKSTWKPLFWISRLFSPDQRWRHSMSLPTIFLTALRR